MGYELSCSCNANITSIAGMLFCARCGAQCYRTEDLRVELHREREAREQLQKRFDNLARKLADKNATELSYFFQDKELYDMALSLASELGETERERDELREVLKECMQHLILPTEDPWMSEVDEVYQKARRVLGE